MKYKKRIIFIISSSIAGGGQIYLYNIVDFIKQDYSVLVICPNGFLYDKLEGVPDVDVFASEINRKNIGHLNEIIKNEIDKYGYVYINAHLLGSALWASLAISNIKECAFTVTVHNKVIYNSISLIKRICLPYIIKYISTKTDRFIAVSQEIADSVRKYSGKNCNYIPSSVPINPSPINASLFSAVKDPIIIGFVGRLSFLKNPIRFLEMAALLNKKHNNLHFNIIGDGKLTQECKDKVSQLEIESKVSFVGFTREPQVEMKKMDILIISSDSEGTPLVLLEAMSMGLPVISTRVGAIPLVIDDRENGMLADLTPDSLAFAVDQLINTQGLYSNVSKKGYDTIKNKYNYEKNISDYMSIVTR